MVAASSVCILSLFVAAGPDKSIVKGGTIARIRILSCTGYRMYAVGGWFPMLRKKMIEQFLVWDLLLLPQSRLAFHASCFWPGHLNVKRLIVYGWFSHKFSKQIFMVGG